MKNNSFENDIKLVPNVFDKLKIVDHEGEQFLHGQLDIIDDSGKLWDTYTIEIKGSEGYPTMFPKLYETGDSFLKIADWHVYEEDKSCCVDVTPNEIILCKDGLNIVDYIKRFAIPYLANQTFRKREGYYLYGEYSHGIFGRVEYYQSKLKAKNPTELIRMFDLIIKDYNPSRPAFCPFCNKTKFRECHRNAFRELQNVKRLLYQDGVKLIPFFKANPDYKLPKI
jgi:hypothetical protein